VGDEALKAVAALLAENRRTEDVVCRWGGEEFAVLLPGMNHAIACRHAEQWRTRLAAMTIDGLGNALRLTASFGVTTFPQQAGNIVDLMHLADERLYRAKSNGRNCVVGLESAPPA
jgi:diguanylate cyclase (GGDEF)-like protein